MIKDTDIKEVSVMISEKKKKKLPKNEQSYDITYLSLDLSILLAM